MDVVTSFERERPRLVRIAGRLLGDHAEAEDIVQQAWLRLDRADDAAIDSLPAWLTTVVTRLCLDRLKASVPRPLEPGDPEHTDRAGPDRASLAPGPSEEAVLADSMGAALHVVLDRLTPSERVAFVLHDLFSVEFATVADILDCLPATARKLASRARAKITGAGAGGHEGQVAPAPAVAGVVPRRQEALRRPAGGLSVRRRGIRRRRPRPGSAG